MNKFAKGAGENGDLAVSGGGQEFLISDIKVPSFLVNCCPEPYVKCYIHVIDMCTEYDMPIEDRKQVFHALMASNQCFYGILTRTTLPPICSFPVWSDLGKIRINLLNNQLTYTFTNNQLEIIKGFHKFLFMDIVAKVKNCFVFDTTDSSSSSYFIIPLKKKDHGEIGIAWSIMRDRTGIKLDRPATPEDYSDENYAGKVVTPWYRDQNDIPLFYVVTNVNTGMYMHSKMHLREETYSDYYEKKYGLKVTQKHVPLLEVRMITNILESIKPRCITSSVKLKRRKKRDFQTFLHSEFVTKQKFPAVLWYKSTLLPSILHRTHYFLLAEDLRQKIVIEAKVGNLYIPMDRKKEREYFTDEQPGKNEMKNQNANDHFSNQSVGNDQRGEANLRDPPKLSLFQDHSLSEGPTQYNILQALTLLAANDTICLERLETLGDCYLKFITSFSIFVGQPDMKEGDMTKLRSRLIGNDNLKACGIEHGIPGYIQASTFSVDLSWTAPSFRVPLEICNFVIPPAMSSTEFPIIRPELLRNRKLACLLQVSIPERERLTGCVSTNTIDSVKQFFQTHANGNKQETAAALYYMGKQEISMKNVADAVEALIGTYLQKCGIHGAFQVAKYFGIIEDENYPTLLASRVPSAVSPNKIKRMLPDYNRIERLLQYEFQDKALLLEVFTHPSCLTNTLTGCYQRLEFIGDAVLDFLITSYIYEYCGQLSPGQISDLRSALVNNHIFGALVVRLGLHEFLVDPAESVKNEIATFAKYQRKENYAIYGNELMVEVKATNRVILAEEVRVPKVLADVFEALAGAIFIDSGYNLKRLWKIYYNIMKTEITQFSKDIPINPVRALYEMDGKVVFEQ
ncbi:hypothetical protein V9T40_001709 [Parthenolecanium corni]|uniref:Uncharacterized protein n=1 Tax=Parthenolecanium corni TaxID=536013 RepID=A0AAN9TH24_9HEMI